jgi:hypothetical protein
MDQGPVMMDARGEFARSFGQRAPESSRTQRDCTKAVGTDQIGKRMLPSGGRHNNGICANPAIQTVITALILFARVRTLAETIRLQKFYRDT